jgi:hypothetical protein
LLIRKIPFLLVRGLSGQEEGTVGQRITDKKSEIVMPIDSESPLREKVKELMKQTKTRATTTVSPEEAFQRGRREYRRRQRWADPPYKDRTSALEWERGWRFEKNQVEQERTRGSVQSPGGAQHSDRS